MRSVAVMRYVTHWLIPSVVWSLPQKTMCCVINFVVISQSCQDVAQRSSNTHTYQSNRRRYLESDLVYAIRIYILCVFSNQPILLDQTISTFVVPLSFCSFCYCWASSGHVYSGCRTAAASVNGSSAIAPTSGTRTFHVHTSKTHIKFCCQFTFRSSGEWREWHLACVCFWRKQHEAHTWYTTTNRPYSLLLQNPALVWPRAADSTLLYAIFSYIAMLCDFVCVNK